MEKKMELLKNDKNLLLIAKYLKFITSIRQKKNMDRSFVL